MILESKPWFWLVVFSISLTLLYLLSPILTPFIVAALLAYMGDPVADKLEAWGLSRTLSVVVVFFSIVLGLLLVFLFLIPVLETQIKTFVMMVPRYIEFMVSTLAPYLQSKFGVDPSVLEMDRLKELISSNWQETGGFIRNAVQTLSKSGFVVLNWIANIALVPILSFYLLRDWDRMVAYVDDLLPRSIQPTIAKLAKESDEILGAFVRGQLMVMLGLGILYSLGLWLVGLDFALLIGLVAGLVSFVPYLGLVVGIGVAGTAILFQTHEPLDLLKVAAVFGAAQILEGTVLTPLLVGERIGLHPVTVIFAVLAGGQLFGFFGILLALPVAAVLAVIMRHIHDSYKQSQIYTDEHAIELPLVEGEQPLESTEHPSV